MGWLSRLVRRLERSGAEGRAARLEAAGRLDEAFAAYREEGRPEDAARILLARAQAEPDLVQRKALLNVVLSHAPASSAVAADARRLRALATLDIARANPGPGARQACLAAAADLEAALMFREAADAFSLAGDVEGQTRTLAACGAIDDLESIFDQERKSIAEQRQREQLWKTIRDLDAIGQRRAALDACRAWLDGHPLDEEVAARARGIQQRLVRRGTLAAIIDGRPLTIVVDAEVTVGRADASIVVPSPALSRRHLILGQGPAGPVIADAGSRNGTTLAGARVEGSLPIGAGVDLLLGGQVPLRAEPRPGGGVLLSVSGQSYLAPLGPLRLGDFVVDQADGAMVLRSLSAATPAVLNGLTCDAVVDLSYGDQIRTHRDGPIVFEVLTP